VEIVFPVVLTLLQLMDNGEHLVHSLLAAELVVLELGQEKGNATIPRKCEFFKM